MSRTVIEQFLDAPIEDRFRMAVDPANAEPLRSYFGQAAFQSYRRMAEQSLPAMGATNLSGLGTPVIVVPGVMGSQLVGGNPAGIYWFSGLGLPRIRELGLTPDGTGDMTPGLGVHATQLLPFYDPFLNPIIWPTDQLHCVTHPYDWRKAFAHNTRALRDRIVEQYAENRRRRVHLVGHSMGGLLIRATLMEHGDELWPMIDRVVLAGTPNYGSAKLAGFLKYHIRYDGLQMRVLGLFLPPAVFRSLWGPIAMLPAPAGIYPGTRAGESGAWATAPGSSYAHPCANFDLYHAEAWQLGLGTAELAAFQRALDAAAQFHRDLDAYHQDLDPDKYERIAVFVAVGQENTFRVELPPALGAAPGAYVRHAERREADPHRDGDGSVTLASAELRPAGVVRYVRAQHAALPMYQQVFDNIFRWLRREPLSLGNTPLGAVQAHLADPVTPAYPDLVDPPPEPTDPRLAPLASDEHLDPATEAQLRDQIAAGDIELPPAMHRVNLL